MAQSDHHHPSGRPATRIDTGLRTELIADKPLARFVSQESWLLAKERQRLEDGTSARIEGVRLARLETMPSHWPGAHLSVIEAPMVVGHETSEVQSAFDAARPTITRAVHAMRERLTRGTGGGGDAA